MILFIGYVIQDGVCRKAVIIQERDSPNVIFFFMRMAILPMIRKLNEMIVRDTIPNVYSVVCILNHQYAKSLLHSQVRRGTMIPF